MNLKPISSFLLILTGVFIAKSSDDLVYGSDCGKTFILYSLLALLCATVSGLIEKKSKNNS